MTQEEKEFLFIEALALALNCSKGRTIVALNSGEIFVFNQETLHDFYSEITDNVQSTIEEDIKNKELIKLDSNTFAMWA